MRVLVAGASGFLGLATVRVLAQAGHEVVGLVRSAEKGAAVKAEGATPAIGDILALPSLLEAARGCDALVHLAETSDEAARTMGQSLAAKVRVDGAYNLVTVARKVGARRLLVGSGTWLIGGHAEPITEVTNVDPYGTALFNWQAERAAMESNRPGELEVVVIRPVMVYGNGGWFKPMVEKIRAGTYRVPGGGSNHWSTLALGDCGEAMRAVLERGKAGEVYLAADDEPIRLRDFVDLIAHELGVPRPESVPLEEAAKRVGEATARHQGMNQQVVNAKLKGLGWRPRFPSFREGGPAVIREIGSEGSRR